MELYGSKNSKRNSKKLMNMKNKNKLKQIYNNTDTSHIEKQHYNNWKENIIFSFRENIEPCHMLGRNLRTHTRNKKTKHKEHLQNY